MYQDSTGNRACRLL